MHGSTFTVDLSFMNRLSKKIGQASDKYDQTMKQRITRATTMVWQIAHQKRPMISKAQMKYEHRSTRVSDPGAEAGVPVQTGALQASITQKVSKTGMLSYQGEVGTRGIPYASFIEYGTSKMWARPFMRPAINLTQDAIKRMMGLKVEGNL